MALSLGSVQSSLTDATLPVAAKPVGLAGASAGAVVALSDAGPMPPAFTARTLNT